MADPSKSDTTPPSCPKCETVEEVAVLPIKSRDMRFFQCARCDLIWVVRHDGTALV